MSILTRRLKNEVANVDTGDELERYLNVPFIPSSGRLSLEMVA